MANLHGLNLGVRGEGDTGPAESEVGPKRDQAGPEVSGWARDPNTVYLQDSEGNLVSNFYQYGLINWEQFHSCVCSIICTSTPDWAIFELDNNAPHRRGLICFPGPEVPAPGDYVILSRSGEPIVIQLISQRARLRNFTNSNTPARIASYQKRVRARDPFCLVSGQEVYEGRYNRFTTAHIFPRAHDGEWLNKGYNHLITDTAPSEDVGGFSKIDSIQNIMLLRADLHAAWDDYQFAVDPDRGYIIVPFTGGYDDIAGNTLKLSHILDPTIRPLDELFRDHYFQAVLKNMKGAGEPSWDYEDALGGGRMDLSIMDIWGGQDGREHLEFELAHRLHELQVAQEGSSD